MIEDVEVPEGWRRVRLGDLGTFKTSSVDKKVNKDEKWVKLINYMDVYKHNFVDKSLELMDVTANDHEIAVSRVKKGDILFTPSSETPDDIGHSGVVLGCPPNTLYSYHLMRLDIKGEIESDLKFRGYFCNYGGVLKEFARISTGVTRFTLCKSDFENTKVIIPSSFPEQHKIADILETVDNAIERTDTIIEKYKRIKQGLMQDLLTRGVVENEELGVMSYELRDEKKHRFKDSPLGRIPEEWEVVEIYEICNIINGGTPKTEKTEYWNGDIPWLSVEDFNTGKRWVVSSTKYITELGLKKSATRLLRKGMLIISARGSVGVIAQLGRDMAFNQTSYGLDSKDKSHITNDFLYYALKHYINSFLSLAYGNVFDTITRDTFKETKIPIPPLSEQHRIASVLSQMDQTIEKEQKYKQKLESIKQGLMEDLLTGKVRVNHLIKEGMENVQTA